MKLQSFDIKIVNMYSPNCSRNSYLHLSEEIYIFVHLSGYFYSLGNFDEFAIKPSSFLSAKKVLIA